VRDLEKQLKLERIKRDRRKYLYEQGAISREQFDEVAFNSQALAERLNNARSSLEELQNGTRYEQKAAQQAVVDQLSAEITNLDITIAKSTLKAPFSGTIGQRSVDEGTVVNTGTSIIRLVEDIRAEVKIGVPIDVARKLVPGTQKELEIGGKNYSARVKSILPEVDEATRTKTVILQLPSSARVSPREIARFKITQNVAIEGYWLPITALVKGDRGLWSSYAVIENKDNPNSYQVERRLVEVLETNGKRVLVRGTIQAGDTIVIDGTQRLVPGQLVSKGNW
ncbi:MAG: efflux RND transporter periplasmic adaptor subunit, partial [Cyanobacteria bacterium P01_D01_bin.50]